nr:MAG TPA: hypothetical protein [Caudoviricetes sp.]
MRRNLFYVGFAFCHFFSTYRMPVCAFLLLIFKNVRCRHGVQRLFN